MTDELLDFRDMLKRELDSGYFDRQSWSACARWAREDGRLDIAENVQKYIDHYEESVNVPIL